MRRAFSLVEVMIVIALSMIILATVYAGFRVATQSIIACNRMSIENRLLTAGVARALDEVDFWNKFDRPGWRPARTTPTTLITGENGGYDGIGNDSTTVPQPFTPFADGLHPDTGLPVSGSWKPGLNEIPAAQNSYDHLWLPHDPKTWYRGDGRLYLGHGWKAEDCQFGDYALFSGSRTTVQHRGSSAVVGVPGMASDVTTWYASQQKGRDYGLGFYGWWEYLPANALIDWYDRDSSNRGIRSRDIAARYMGDGSSDTTPPYAWKNVTGIGRFSLWLGTPWSSFNERPVTRSAFLWEHMLGICAPRPAIGSQPADDVNQALRLNRWMGGMRWVGYEYQSPFNLLSKELTRDEPLVVSRPKGWPQVTWDVRRYKMYSRTVNDCYVRVFDPLSAKMVEINFRAVGTTLRGARLQRGLD